MIVRQLVAVIVLLGMVAAPTAAAQSWTVEQVIMLMRHGVRPPLHQPVVPAHVAPDPWPSWSVPDGYLTPHGADAIRQLGVADAHWLAQSGLTGSGCPSSAVVISDSDQRTIATGDAYLTGLAPGCAIANRHLPQDVPDPLFEEYGNAGVSADAARLAVDQALGPDGIAGAERRAQPALDVLNRILCGDRPSCGVGDHSAVVIDPSGAKRPRVTGALGYASTLAQAVLLQYADGKPLSEVGWGRASAEDIKTIGMLHSLGFEIMARPRVLADANAGLLARKMVDEMRAGTALAVLVGHDSDIASIAGLLDVHWSVPDYADDDPAPGGALGFEVVRDAAGQRFARAFYRAQTLEQTRALSGEPPARIELAIPGCDGQVACPIDRFTALLVR